MMIRCLAIDDEPIALEKLNTYIKKIPYLTLVASCESTFDAMKVMSEEKIDAIFVDINIPDVNGIEFIRSLNDPPLVIFITAYSEYAVDSYGVNAIDYILKPYSFTEFQRAANKLQKQWTLMHQRLNTSHTDSEILYLKVDYRYVKVNIDDIIYIEGMNEYLKIWTVSEDPFLTHTTFKHLLCHLPDNFLQIHRSYIINMKHIKEIDRSIVLMSNGARISISDSNKDVFNQYLQMHSIKK